MSTDLVVLDQKLPIININFDEVEKELQRLLTFYQGLEVTEDTIKEAKEVQKKLAKLGKEINQRKIEIKKEMSAPITAFEDRCKRLIAMVDEVNAPIKDGLQVFEDKRREEKADQVNKLIQLKIAEKGLLPKYAKLITVDEKYLNVTTTMKSIKDDIDEKVNTLAKIQDEAAKAQETIAAHIKQMNELLDLANPILGEEFSWLNDEDLDLQGSLAEITRRAKDRKAAEVAAVEKQKAIEAAAAEKARAAEIEKAPDPVAIVAEEFKIPVDVIKAVDPDSRQYNAFVQAHTPSRQPQILSREQTAEALADFIINDTPPPYIQTPAPTSGSKIYTLTIKVPEAQLQDLENYLTDNLIQIVIKR